jgi:adenylate cyclase
MLHRSNLISEIRANAEQQPPVGRTDVIEATMRRESVSSELERVKLVIGLLGFLLAVLALLRSVPYIINGTLRTRLLMAIIPLAVGISLYLAYEVGAYLWLKKLQRADRIPPTAFRYANALVEISLPTASLISGTLIMGMLPSLLGPVPFVYFPFIFLTALNLDSVLCVFAGAVAGAEFLVICSIVTRGPAVSPADAGIVSMLTSPHQYVIKSLLLAVSGLIAGFIAHQLRQQLTRAIATLQERDRAISIFGQHVSTEVAELLLKQPLDLTPQEGDVCVMFLDIRDFSRLANDRSPSEVMSYLNALFGFMIPAINEHHGIVNKFLGDGFMAVFGAPIYDDQQCHHAVSAAIKILGHVEKLNAEGRIPPTRLGIGLHIGRVMTGNVGGTDRKEYTIIGDAVNLASRIEQATKQLGGQLLVSQAVETLIAGAGYAGQDMGLIELRGQAQPVRLFKLA